MSRHQIYCDEDYEITLGYQFSNETLYVQVFADPHDSSLAEQLVEDIDIECELIKKDKRLNGFPMKFAQMIDYAEKFYHDYLSVEELENFVNCDKTALYNHLLEERTDRELCNQIYRWKLTGPTRQQRLTKVEKKVV